MNTEFDLPLKSGFTVYSKSGCPGCKKVKELLKKENHEHNVVDCDDYLLFDRDSFLLFIKKLAGGVDVTTFPIVFKDGVFFILSALLCFLF